MHGGRSETTIALYVLRGTMKIKEDILQLLINNDKKLSCVEIAKLYNVSVKYVYRIKFNNGLTNKTNLPFQLDNLQNQILLSGILGDGNFKKNGKNYFYRESHAEDELDYLSWKAHILMPLIRPKGVHPIKSAGYNKQQMYLFETKNSPSLNQYAKMSRIEVIQQLNIFGFILWFFDDGWQNNNQLIISGGILSEKELEEVCLRLSQLGVQDVHITGKKRRDIVIPSHSVNIFYLSALIIMPKNSKIIKKKFKHIKV